MLSVFIWPKLHVQAKKKKAKGHVLYRSEIHLTTSAYKHLLSVSCTGSFTHALQQVSVELWKSKSPPHNVLTIMTTPPPLMSKLKADSAL